MVKWYVNEHEMLEARWGDLGTINRGKHAS